MSIWGIANPLPIPQFVTFGSDVPLPAGSSTQVVISGTFQAATGLNVYPWLMATFAILLGATPPTALQVTGNIPLTATFFTYVVPPALLVANATLLFTVGGAGASSRTTYAGAGNTIGISAQPTTQAATAKFVGTAMFCGLGLGPDV